MVNQQLDFYWDLRTGNVSGDTSGTVHTVPYGTLDAF